MNIIHWTIRNKQMLNKCIIYTTLFKCDKIKINRNLRYFFYTITITYTQNQ